METMGTRRSCTVPKLVRKGNLRRSGTSASSSRSIFMILLLAPGRASPGLRVRAVLDPLQVAHRRRRQVTQYEIDEGDGQVDGHGLVGARDDVPAREQELVHGYHGDQRGVLDERDEPVTERGQRDAQRLRDEHEAVSLERPESQRARRLALAVPDGE